MNWGSEPIRPIFVPLRYRLGIGFSTLGQPWHSGIMWSRRMVTYRIHYCTQHKIHQPLSVCGQMASTLRCNGDFREAPECIKPYRFTAKGNKHSPAMDTLEGHQDASTPIGLQSNYRRHDIKYALQRGRKRINPYRLAVNLPKHTKTASHGTFFFPPYRFTSFWTILGTL